MGSLSTMAEFESDEVDMENFPEVECELKLEPEDPVPDPNDNDLLQQDQDKEGQSGTNEEDCQDGMEDEKDMEQYKQIDESMLKCELVENGEPIKTDIKEELNDEEMHDGNASLGLVKCSECNYSTANPTSLIRHKASKHKVQKQGRYNCTLCNYTTSTFAHLKRHISSKIHKGENEEAIKIILALEDMDKIDLNCPVCSFKTNDRSNLNRHIMRKHPSTAPLGPKTTLHQSPATSDLQSEVGLKFPCSLCSHVANFPGTLKRHMRSEHNPFISAFKKRKEEEAEAEGGGVSTEAERLAPRQSNPLSRVSCELCPFTTTNKTYLRDHAALHEGPDGLLKCKFCSFTTLDHKEVRGHMDANHQEDKYKCPEESCGKSFWNVRALVSHKKKHSPGSLYECWQCHYKNPKAHAIAYHFNSVHLKIKPHLCDKCPGAFPSKGRLLIHQRSVHFSADKRFRHHCNICGKDFSTKQYLIIHTRLHTGERPHTCDECGKSFSDSAYFSNHVKNHARKAAGKFHQCDICDKKFTAASSLRNHKFVHSRPADYKPQKYSNDFKLTCIKRVAEVGVSQCSSELGVNFSTLRGWISLTKNPQRCEVCDKVFSYPAQLHNHMKTHDATNVKKERAPKLRPVIDDDFRRTVVEYANAHGAASAASRFEVSESTLRGWRAITDKPLTCPICGKQFSYPVNLNTHIKGVHAGTKAAMLACESLEECSRSQDQTFQDFLEDQNMFPSQEEIERKRQEIEERRQIFPDNPFTGPSRVQLPGDPFKSEDGLDLPEDLLKPEVILKTNDDIPNEALFPHSNENVHKSILLKEEPAVD